MAAQQRQQQPQLRVIPAPAVVEHVGPGVLTLPACVAVGADEGLAAQAAALQAGLRQRFATPCNLLPQQASQQGQQQEQQPLVTLRLEAALPELEQLRWGRQEGYVLACDARGVRISALSPTGAFYGVQTLLQALAPAPEQPSRLCLPHTRVVDAPRFMWRGVLLDVGRHFFPLPFILKLLDLLALYKLNRFHWHLTEDQGWRLDVPALPRLAEVAAWRGRRPAAASPPQQHDQPPGSPHQQQQQQQQQPGQRTSQPGLQQGSPGSQQQQPAASSGAESVLGRPAPSAATYHGGCYSREDVAKVVAYAAERCIEVVPEIELPGHCVAALAAYPQLSCTGEVAAVSTHWGIHEDVYCAGSEDAFTFLETVLDQVVAQFPCSYIHIGGDEVPKVRWEECARCQERMHQEGLSTEAELQSYFVSRISRYLATRNRRIIGWDEILEGGLADGATVMSWRGSVGGIIAAKSGHDVIMTPTSNCYFDYRQAPSAAEPGAWYACLPLQVVYSYDPVPGPWPDAPLAPGPEEQADEHTLDEGGDEADGCAPMMRSPSGSLGGDSGGSTAVDAVPDGQGGRELPAGAAVVPPAAAAAAGPHYPGHPPGASLAPLAAAAGAPAAVAASSGRSASSSRPSVLTDAEAAHILGSQANLWTEYVADEATAEYMLLPRLAALAEAVWTPVAVKDWDAFSARLSDHLPLLNQLGYLYRPLDQ